MYDLHVYRSDGKEWSTKEARIAGDMDTDYVKVSRHQGTTTISAGGGSLGWVDLWWGILLCNVLDEDKNPVMRLIQWPVPVPCNTSLEYHLEWDRISPRRFCDVTFINGLIRFVELKFHQDTAICNNKKRVLDQGWTATTWSRVVSSNVWHQGFTVDTDGISVTDSSYPHLLPEILDEENSLTWDRVISVGPTLSLRDDVVYIMAKLSLEHPVAWVLAVNTRRKTPEALQRFSSQRLQSLEPIYVQCSFSNCLGTTEDNNEFEEVSISRPEDFMSS